DAVKVDVRVVAATNVDLEKARSEGRFRDDLFFRLDVVALRLPPLRERPTDIPLLAQHFVTAYAQKMGKRVSGISSRAMTRLVSHPWPGNVRELENAIERAVVLTQGDTIEPGDLPPAVTEVASTPVGESDVLSLTHLPFAQAKALVMGAFERRYLSAMLEKSGGNITAAAMAAGLERSNFRRQLKAAGLRSAPGDEHEA
ncbi:MAG: sigma-54-dependent Fis family transcriptional regulator, partial [Myxococcaceae bacterium]|nr:sigma-54-dependent Fis family transcriptional regulator [Myxococcaceae bacterium]